MTSPPVRTRSTARPAPPSGDFSRRVAFLIVGIAVLAVAAAIGVGLGLNKYLRHRRAVAVEERAAEAFEAYEQGIRQVLKDIGNSMVLSKYKEHLAKIRAARAQVADLPNSYKQSPRYAALEEAANALDEAERVWEKILSRYGPVDPADKEKLFAWLTKGHDAWGRAGPPQ